MLRVVLKEYAEKQEVKKQALEEENARKEAIEELAKKYANQSSPVHKFLLHSPPRAIDSNSPKNSISSAVKKSKFGRIGGNWG